MKKKQWIALLLALMCILSAGCRSQQTEETTPPVSEETGGDLTGNDWRTWGWVNDQGVFETQDGEKTALLLCVFPEKAVLYYDDAAQRVFADLCYPAPIEDAQQAYASFSLLDRNGDGTSDIQLLFVHDDGTQTELFWRWDGTQFVSDSAPGGEEPAQDAP